MKLIAGCLAVLPFVLGSSALAGEIVRVTVRGFVESNQIGDPPLGDAVLDDEVTMTLFLDSDVFLDSVNFPVRGYVIDEASYNLQLGSVSIGLQDPFWRWRGASRHLDRGKIRRRCIYFWFVRKILSARKPRHEFRSR